MLDPRDVRRYQRREGERRRKGVVAALSYGGVAAVLVAAAAVYWNFDRLRGLGAGSLQGDAEETAASAGVVAPDPKPAQAAVEAPAPRRDDPAPRGIEPSPAVPQAPAAPAEAPPVEPAPAVAAAAPPSEPIPEEPVEPETFDFGIAVNSVSEADAAAAVLVLRHGGRRAASSVVWWTSRGTATPGADYADLGRVTLPFPAGAQNRTIRIPIVGDRATEGPESFFVHVTASGAGAAAEPESTEVVINDDD
jgi:hypothetical protein